MVSTATFSHRSQGFVESHAIVRVPPVYTTSREPMPTRNVKVVVVLAGLASETIRSSLSPLKGASMQFPPWLGVN